MDVPIDVIDVTITGAKPSGYNQIVRAQVFGSKPPEGKPDPPKKMGFRHYDVFVEGFLGGTATIRITNDLVTGTHMMHYLDGTEWIPARNLNVKGKTIHGEIDVSKLHWTPIVIGT